MIEVRKLEEIFLNGKRYIEISNHAVPGIRPRCYYINEDGSIYNKSKNMFMSIYINHNGYWGVNLMKTDGKQAKVLVHRILMITFNFNYNYDKLEVNHMDGDKTNRDLNNLEWCTQKENVDHALKTGLRPIGENHPQHILTESNVREICELILKGEKISRRELAKKYGCDESTIGSILSGKKWKHITNEYPPYIPHNNKSFTEYQVHQICKIFQENKGMDIKYLVNLIVNTIDLPMGEANLDVLKTRIRNIYFKKIKQFNHIYDQYNW